MTKDQDTDPIELFQSWLADAHESEPNDPTAMTLATVEALSGRDAEANAARERATEAYAAVRGPSTVHDLRAEAAWYAVRGEWDPLTRVLDQLLDLLMQFFPADFKILGVDFKAAQSAQQFPQVS